MTDDSNKLYRFLHWGPIVTLTATLAIIWTTYSWWPEDDSFTNQAHSGLFVLLNLLAMYNYVKAMVVGPGFLPRKWQPLHRREAQFMQFCMKCNGFKAPRSHHCRKCDRCVKKMDHHCPWINQCVGWSNQAYFVYFLFFYMLSNLHASMVLFLRGFNFFVDTYLYGDIKSISFIEMIICAISCVVSLAIVVCMLKLLIIQIVNIVKNMTSIERWIVEKARCRRLRSKRQLKAFIYPYNLGWFSNLGQVFKLDSRTRGMGIEFMVCKSCDKYTLTREQLAQKKEKRERARTFKCIQQVPGHWLPILSQGLMVTICVPCTDDPRISLEPNDLIRVTRIRDYWLYGERVLIQAENHSKIIQKDTSRSCETEDHSKILGKETIRGWFPRRCAIDITEISGDIAENKKWIGKRKLNQD